MHPTGDAILVERATGKEVRHFDAGDVSAPQDLTFSANGKMLATINRTGTIRLWDTATGKLLQTMQAKCSDGLTARLRFTAGDQTLVSSTMRYGEKGGLLLEFAAWSVATGQVQTRRDGPKNIAWCQALSPDGKLLAWSGRPYRGLFEEAELW
jgi:WD40 repeat protein